MSSHRPHAPLFLDPRTRELYVPATRDCKPQSRRRFKRWLFRLLGRPVLP